MLEHPSTKTFLLDGSPESFGFFSNRNAPTKNGSDGLALEAIRTCIYIAIFINCIHIAILLFNAENFCCFQ